MIQQLIDTSAGTAVKLYRALAEGDLRAVRSCYDANARYSDPVFGQLGRGSACYIWPVIFSQIRRPEWKFEVVDAGLTSARLSTKVNFVFAETGRPTSLRIATHLAIREARVVRHDDDFDIDACTWMAFPKENRFRLWTPHGRERLKGHARSLLSNLEMKS